MTEELQATAPAEPEAIVEAPAEVEASEPQAEPEAPKSAREALENAFKKAAENEAKAKEEPKETTAEKAEENSLEPAKEVQPRDEQGKFAAKKTETAAEKPQEAVKEQKQPEVAGRFNEAPARFSEAAKKEWASAPESVRAEAQRAVKEMEQGIAKYQAQVEPLKPFFDMAQGDPQALAAAMTRLVNAEQGLRQNPVQAFPQLARAMGYSPEQLGKILLNQDPGQPQPQDREITSLHQQSQQLMQTVGQLQASMKQIQEGSAVSQVEAFARENEHFDALADDIAVILGQNPQMTLPDAYQTALERAQQIAARFVPQPVVEDPPPPVPTAQTRPARSLTGAPSPGSNPTTARAPSKSPREALQRAFGA